MAAPARVGSAAVRPLLSLFRRRVVPPRYGPVTPRREVLAPFETRSGRGDDEGATGATIPVFEVPDRMKWAVPDRAWRDREDLRLGRVAGLIAAGSSPWDGALRVFGGAGVARDATGAGLSATLAGRERENAHR